MYAWPLSLAALAASSSPYPATEVLAAFGDACAKIETLDGAEAHVVAAGWTKFDPAPDSAVGQIVALGRSEAEKLLANDPTSSLSPMRVYHRDVAGESLELVLSGVTRQGAPVNGCRLYDVGETRPIAIEAAEKWIGRPVGTRNDFPEISIAEWSPGYGPDHDSFALYFVPPGSPAIQLVKVSGITLKADFVGAAE